MRGIKYHSSANTSGYGLSGLAYIRALINNDVPVWWQPLVYSTIGPVTWTPSCSAPSNDLLRIASDDAVLSDIASLTQASCRPVEYDVQIVHLIPEYWPYLMEPGRLRVGYTMWEMDKLPDSWPSLLNLADRILVPDRRTRDLFINAGIKPSIHVVPHIRRHVWNSFSVDEVAQARKKFCSSNDNYVFYTINAWEPRKAIPDLVQAYLEEFNADESVTLLLKTTDSVVAHPNSRERLMTQSAMQELVSSIQQRIGKSSIPEISLFAETDVSGREIDLIHNVGNCYISLSHAECWSLGAFDAAALGRPIIMTGWGGQTDFMGEHHPGLVKFQMVPVERWLAYETHDPQQNWAQCDIAHARRLMRHAFNNRQQHEQQAESLRYKILTQYGEPVIAKILLDALS